MALAAVAALLSAMTAYAGNVEVINAQFGLFCQSEAGTPSFMPGTAVPLVAGQTYGWVIGLKSDKPAVHWREEFTLPDAPAQWGSPDGQTELSISADKKVSVVEKDAPLEAGGLILNIWSVAPGDPKGKYSIRVVIDKAVERTFEFNVLDRAQIPNLRCPPLSGQSAAKGS
jgi:hypothetical protein